MAVKLADAFILIDGDDKPLNKTLGDARKNTDTWASNLGLSVKTLATGAIAGGALAAAGAVAAIGKAAFDVSNDTKKAANDIAASLGIPTEEAEKFADVAKRVYGNNFADSIGEAGAAVTLLAQQIEGLSGTALQQATEDAFAISDVFGADVSETISAATSLIDNFGLSSDEAFDLVAAGFQKGLNRSGDFLDTVNEYSTQFGEGGASAQEFFNLLESGLAGGALGTDKAADAFKEFRLRILDGSDATAEALDNLEGITDSGFLRQLEDGTVSVADAFSLVLDGINSIEDPALRLQTGTALLGTQFEDLGDAAAAGLSLTGESFDNLGDVTDTLQAKYENFGDFFSGLWRRAAVAVSPLTDSLLSLANDALPAIESAFSGVETFLSNLFSGEGIGSGVESNIEILNVLREWFDENLPLIQELVENVTGAMSAFWDEHGETITRIIETAFDIIERVFDTVLRNILDTVTLFLQVLTGDFEGAGETLEGIIDRTLEAMFDQFEDIFNLIDDVVKLGFDSIVGLFRSAGRRMVKALTDVDWSGIGTGIIDNLKQGLSFGDIGGWFKSNVANPISNLLPGSPPKDKTSPFVRLPEAGRGIIEQLQSGIDASSLKIMPPDIPDLDMGVNGASGSGFGGGTFTFNIENVFNGPADEGTVREATTGGILDAARSMGLSGV